MSFADFVLALVFFLVAVLFSSVGHAGASGYLAVMGLMGVPVLLMKPIALLLNVLVGGIGTWRFVRAGLTDWKSLWPFVISSVPCAWIASWVPLSAEHYKKLIAFALLLGGMHLFAYARQSAARESIQTNASVSRYWALLVGALIGLLAGLTGTGGGIFLTPILIIGGQIGARQAAAITAPFVLFNSISGLWAQASYFSVLPTALPLWMIAVVLGAWLGTQLGIHWVSVASLRRILGVVLWVAAFKLFWA